MKNQNRTKNWHRVNMSLHPKLVAKLKREAKKAKLSRSAFVSRLIEDIP